MAVALATPIPEEVLATGSGSSADNTPALLVIAPVCQLPDEAYPTGAEHHRIGLVGQLGGGHQIGGDQPAAAIRRREPIAEDDLVARLGGEGRVRLSLGEQIYVTFGGSLLLSGWIGLALVVSQCRGRPDCAEECTQSTQCGCTCVRVFLIVLWCLELRSPSAGSGRTAVSGYYGKQG